MATYAISIGGTPRAVTLEAFAIEDVLNEVASVSLQVLSRTGTYRPAVYDTISVTENGTAIFGGKIQSVVESSPPDGHGGTAALAFSLTAKSFSAYPQELLISASYPVQSLKARLQQFIDDDLGPAYGTTLHGSQDDGPDLPAQDVEDIKGDELLNLWMTTAAGIDGNGWGHRIDPDNKLRATYTGEVAAPFDVTQTAGVVANVQGDDIEIEETINDQYANRVFVEVSSGPETASQTWLGSEGVSSGGYTRFSLNFPIIDNTDSGFPNQGYVDGVLIGPIGFGFTGVESGWNWDYVNSQLVIIDTDPWLPTGSQVLSFSPPYVIEYPITAMAEDAAAIATYGLRERKYTPENPLTLENAQAYADGLLLAQSPTKRQIHYTTRQLGISPGMTQTANVAKRNINATVLVQEVATTMRSSTLAERRVSAVVSDTFQGTFRGTLAQWMKTGSSSSSPTASRVPAGLLKHAAISLDNAALKAAADTPQLIVSIDSPKRIKPVAASFRLKTTAGAYTNIDPDASIYLIEGGKPMSLGYLSTSFDDWFSAVADKMTDVPIPAAIFDSPDLLPVAQADLPDTSDLVGEGLYLLIDNDGAGAFTGGGSGNRLDVNVWYVEESVTEFSVPTDPLIPAGSLAFTSAGYPFIAVHSDTGARYGYVGPSSGGNSSIFGGLVFHDSGEAMVVGTPDDAASLDADLEEVGTFTAANDDLRSAASNLSDRFYVLDRKNVDPDDVVKLTNDLTEDARYVGVGDYTAIGVRTDNSLAILGDDGEDHLDSYGFTGSPSTFVTFTGADSFGGGVGSGQGILVLRNDQVVCGVWDGGDNHPKIAHIDDDGTVLNMWDVGAADDFIVSMCRELDDLSVWVSVYIDADDKVVVSKIRLSDGAVLKTWDKTTVNEDDISWDNAIMAVLPVDVAA